MDLKVGDRVKNSVYGEGVIKYIDKSEELRYAVEFDYESVSLHSCKGHCNPQKGYWCDTKGILSDRERIELIKERNDKKMHTSINFNPMGFTISKVEISTKKAELERYIINNGATILFWDDNTKSISKRHKDDPFDKELGFLFAYYYKKCGLSNGARKRVIDCIDYNKIKTFLFEFYVNDSGKTYEQARSYLRQLKVEGKVDKKDIVGEVKKDSFKIGDKVRIIGKSEILHGHPIGSIATIEKIGSDSLYLVRDGFGQHVYIEDVEKIN